MTQIQCNIVNDQRKITLPQRSQNVPAKGVFVRADLYDTLPKP